MAEIKTLAELMAEIEALVIGYAIQLYNTREEAAKVLGMSRRNLFNKTGTIEFGAIAKGLSDDPLGELNDSLSELDCTMSELKKNMLLIEEGL